jgi:hypothetical protein
MSLLKKYVAPDRSYTHTLDQLYEPFGPDWSSQIMSFIRITSTLWPILRLLASHFPAFGFLYLGIKHCLSHHDLTKIYDIMLYDL